MAPSPAAGKQPQTGAPKTPTKLTRKPQGGTPQSQKPGQGNSTPSAKGTPSTPRPNSNVKKPVPSTPKPQTPKTEDAKSSVKDAAKTTQKQAGDVASQAQSQSGANDEDEGPLSKVSQAGEQANNGLQQAAPEPIKDDDEDGEATGGAEEQAQNAAEDAGNEAGDEADDAAENATEQAAQAGESAADATEGQAQQQKPQQQQRGNGLLKGAQGLANRASGIAGKASGAASKATKDPQGAANDVKDEAEGTANDVKESAEDTAQEAQDTAQEGADEAQEAANQATEANGNLTEDAQDQTDDAQGEVEDQADGAQGEVEDQAEDAQGQVEDQAEDAQEGVQDQAEDAQDRVEDQTEDAQGEVEDQAEGAQAEVEDQPEGAQAEVEDQAEGAQEQAEGQAEDAEGQVEGAEDQAQGAQDEAEEATGQILSFPEPPEGLQDSLDLNVLNGLEVASDSNVYNNEGTAVGRLTEGDAEDLEGYPIGENGEILDEEGDLVGRCELMPEEIKRQLEQAREQGEELPEGADEYLTQIDEYEQQAAEGEDGGEEEDGPQLPGLEIMNGLTCQVDGLIYDADGNTIGRVTEGDPEQLKDATLNENGEFVDSEGNVIGNAVIHDEAAELVEQGIYQAAGTGEELGEDAEQAAEGEEGEGEEAAEGEGVEAEGEEQAEGAEEQAEGIEDQLPGIEALEGRELNEAGEVLDQSGQVLAAITDEDLKQKIADGEIDPSTLKIDEDGQVVDEEGNVLQQLELAEGAQERLAGGPLLDLRILEGRKVNKKGKVLDEDGEEIGELREGETSECAGKKINERGEVLDKKGKTVGRVVVLDNEASQTATKELLEELGELTPAGPDLTVLEGYKVNKKGFIINEDGETIGRLVDGEMADCAGKKVNDQGEVLDKEGEVIGHVTVEGAEEEQQEEEQPEEEQQEEEQQEEETGPELPPLSILEGLAVNKAGKLIDANGAVVGELTEGDAKKLSKSGITADAEGQFWDNKGNVIGRAQTLPQEDAEEEALFAGLEGLHVVEDGWIQDEGGHTVGTVVEGDAKKLIGRTVDEDGDILDKNGSAIGRAERWQEEEAQEETPEVIDLSSLTGRTVNKAGMVIGDEGVPIGRLVEGNAKELAGQEISDEGQIWNNKGQVIGRVELIPAEEREAKPEGPFAGLEGLKVIENGQIADGDGNVVGEITEGDAKRLIGLAVDEDGDIVDRYGNVKGHAEPLPDQEEEAPIDNSVLNGMVLNKQGYVVNDNGTPYGRLIEGDAKELAGRRCDENGIIYGDTGKPAGRCEAIPENERVSRPEGPFAGYEGLRVVKDGWVEDENANRVGQISEGNVKRLVGMAVDEDGDIIDKYGNVKGHAEPWEEEDVEEVDKSKLAGCRINKHGNAVDFSGQIIGKVVDGDVQNMIGKSVDGKGQVWDDAGNVVGSCDLVYGEDTSPEGPFAGFDSLQINKDGTVSVPGGDIIGRITEGDIQKLLGHTIDEDGEIVDKNGNVIGKAERWEPEEKERRKNPMSGYRVNKEGEVRDDNGDLIGRLTEGTLGHCVGQEIDDSGNVVDVDGNKIGECTLLENIAEDYEGPTEEELEEARKRDEERQIAEKMANITQQTLEKMQPICKQINEYMEKADRTPKEELDEDELVNNVQPLIEEGGRILQECNGSLRGLDPDGHIAAQAKGRSGSGEATPEEHRLAESLKELTTTVVTTIDGAKKKLNNMPHAKKKLNPLWSLMTQPLFQILAAVGLLLAGVLGLVGQLLNGLGLGGLVNGLMGGLGINKLMESFGLGGGDDKKKGKSGGGGSKLSSLPIVGGLLGGK